MSQWLCNMSVWYWKGWKRVLSSNTVHLLSQQYTEIIVLLCFWLSRDRRVGQHFTNRGVFTKCGLVSDDLSCFLSIFCASRCFRMVCKIWELIFLSTTAQLLKLISFSTLSPLFVISLYHISITFFFFLILQPISLHPNTYHPSSHLKQLLVFVEA